MDINKFAKIDKHKKMNTGLKKNLLKDFNNFVKKENLNMKKYFFKDDEQKSIKIQKISDLEKKEIEKELVNEISKGDLKKYCLNYIEANVLPLFKRKDLNAHKKDILKYNTETIIQCCGLNKIIIIFHIIVI